MQKKLFLSLFLVGLAWLIEACFCESAKYPFYDFHRLQVTCRQEVVAKDSIWGFDVRVDSVKYVASVYQTVLTTPAFGTSCPEPGENGPKYEPTQIKIFADKDFNDTLKAGASLNSIFYAYDQTQSLAVSKAAGKIGLYLYPGIYDFIYTPYLPKDTSLTYDITIRITKSNAEEVDGVVKGVKFK